MKRLILTIILVCASFAAVAHKPSDSYLSLRVDRQQIIRGQWDIALRDLEYALGLDANDDGSISWGELRASRDAVYAYALTRLQIAMGSRICPITPTALLVDEHSDGHYAVLSFDVVCNAGPASLSIDYRLFFDLDPQHRGLLSVIREDLADAAIFSPERQSIELALDADVGMWRTLAEFGYEGLWHIWMGFDHILFLLSLLLPAALVREKTAWQANLNARAVMWDVLAVVTAFTVAHSLTLSLTVLDYIALPSRWVESAIAGSVALAALNNIYPLFVRRRAWFAFGFGLIHGMGIASVLLDMGLPDSRRLLSLLGFNLGVEAGQLAVVAGALPLIAWLSRYRYYPALVMKLGSAVIAAVAMVWLTERGLDFQVNIF